MRSVILQVAGELHPGPLFIEVYPDVGESLIVLEPDVVVGTVSLYQVALEDEGFLV